MAKKNSKIIWILLIIGALALFWYMGKEGFFKGNFSITNQDITNMLESPQTAIETCTLSLVPQAIFSGDSVTGIIQDGKNTRCSVYARSIEPYSPDWRLVFTGTTDDTGRLSSTQNVEIIGVFIFKAICGSCITNEATLYVNPLPDGEPVICYDSDISLSPFEEQLKFAGFCTDSTGTDSDYCYEGTDHLIEYYCEPLSSPPSERYCGYTSFNCPGMIPGSTCVSGRCVLGSSGGDYGGYPNCDAFRIAEGKEFYSENSGINNIDECEAYANGYCTQFGWWVTRLDFATPDCCIFDCSGGWD